MLGASQVQHTYIQLVQLSSATIFEPSPNNQNPEGPWETRASFGTKFIEPRVMALGPACPDSSEKNTEQAVPEPTLALSLLEHQVLQKGPNMAPAATLLSPSPPQPPWEQPGESGSAIPEYVSFVSRLHMPAIPPTPPPRFCPVWDDGRGRKLFRQIIRFLFLEADLLVK